MCVVRPALTSSEHCSHSPYMTNQHPVFIAVKALPELRLLTFLEGCRAASLATARGSSRRHGRHGGRGVGNGWMVSGDDNRSA